MKIDNDLVASIHYTLSNENGEVIDSSQDQEPLTYLQGHANLVPGLEKEMLGKAVGDKFQVSVEAAEGYGEYDANLIQEMPRSAFGGIDTIEVGMEFHAQTEQGMQIIEVKAVDGDTITIDGNHPLAGTQLNFDIEVTDIRAASEEELSHGHVHAPGGCGHDH